MHRDTVGEVGNDAAWPSSCGDIGRRAVGEIAKVVSAAQAAGAPCFFTRFELDRGGNDIGVYRRKRDLLDSDHWCLAGSTGAQLVPQLQPGPNDIVFVKKKPSGFHGTPLLGYLVERQIDTVIIVGGATIRIALRCSTPRPTTIAPSCRRRRFLTAFPSRMPSRCSTWTASSRTWSAWNRRSRICRDWLLRQGRA